MRYDVCGVGKFIMVNVSRNIFLFGYKVYSAGVFQNNYL